MPLKFLHTYSLPHFNDRPIGQAIDTILIHSMYASDCQYPFDAASCVDLLNRHEVSAHYIITRDGSIMSLVPEEKRAWHAGESKNPSTGEEALNDQSIGIELIEVPGEAFTDAQYEALRELCIDIASRSPIRWILGHDRVSPGRKSDPGALFDWKRFLSSVQSIATLESR